MSPDVPRVVGCNFRVGEILRVALLSSGELVAGRLPVFDHRMPESGQPLDTDRGEGGSGDRRGRFVLHPPTADRVFIRVDAEGRVVRTPAIEHLLRMLRAHCRVFSRDPDAEYVWIRLRGLSEALREVDREAELMGAIAAESSLSGDLPNIGVDTDVESVREETRKPAITPAPGAERDASRLSPADPEVEDRRCKK